MTADLEKALTFLRTKPLQHVVHLKHLHLYPRDMQTYYTEADGEIGILLSYDPTLTSWDRSYYPTASRIFLPTATSQEMAQRLIEQVETQSPTSPVIYKFCESETREVFAQNFRLQLAKTFVSYTTELLESNDNMNGVVMSDKLDERLASLYVANGYAREELSTLFADGALSFAMFQDDQPVCTCLIYQNFDNVWEIAGVRTVESVRRQGYARRIVLAALQTILSRGWVPRYQVDATNTASIRLAESIGLVPCLRFEHYKTLA